MSTITTASRYDGAYGLAGHPEAGVLPGDYRVPGTSMTPHQWQQELQRMIRVGLDLAGQPLHAYAIYSARHAMYMGSRPTHRAAAIFARRYRSVRIIDMGRMRVRPPR